MPFFARFAAVPKSSGKEWSGASAMKQWEGMAHVMFLIELYLILDIYYVKYLLLLQSYIHILQDAI